MGKAILFSAPSGCGKTTIIKELMQYFNCFGFSISATSRTPRAGEVEGKDYYYLSREEFARRVAAGDFLEWEEVYEGTCYGTLKSEVERLWAAGQVAVFDILTRKKIKGEFPKDQTYHVQSFIAKHEAELLANWETLNSENGTYFKIEP